MEQVILERHPMFSLLSYRDRAKCLIQAFRGHFNIEQLLEETLSCINLSLVRTRDPYMDYTDGTDAKCVSFQLRRDGSCRATIGGINKKVSWLRVCAYNARENDVHFFLVPTDGVLGITRPDTKKLDVAYSHVTRTYSSGLEGWRVASVDEVARSI